MRATVLVLLCSVLLGGCSGEAVEQRAREAAEKMKESIPDIQAAALAQKATKEEVRQAQQALADVHEYLGETNGELDAVTVNAIQAFQRAHGLADDGILDTGTQRLLREAATRK